MAMTPKQKADRLVELSQLMSNILNGKARRLVMPTSGPESQGSGKNPAFGFGNVPDLPTSQRDPNGSGSGGNERFGKAHHWPPLTTMKVDGAASTLRTNIKRCFI